MSTVQSYKLDLSSFKKKRAAHAAYFDYLELFYRDPTGLSNSLVCPDLPVPNRLLAENSLMPVPLTMSPSSPNFGKALASQCDYFQAAGSVDVNHYINYLLSKFPEIKNKIVGAMPHCDPHDFVLARLIENLHAYRNAPVIKYHEDLIDLLMKTKVDGSGKIPAQFLRAPQDITYFDFSAAASLPVTTDKDGGLPIQGVYLLQSTYSAEDARSLIERDPTMLRASQRGTISMDDDVVSLTFLLISDAPKDQKLESGYMVITFSLAYSPSTNASIKEVIEAHLPDELDQLSPDSILYENIREPMDLCLNSLLYMTTSEAHRELVKVGSDLEVQYLRTNKPKKKRLLKREMQKTRHDFIRIGKQYRLLDEKGNTVKFGKKSAHIRSGHWRHQRYGENRTLSKAIWIKPARVGVSDGDAPAKDILLQ